MERTLPFDDQHDEIKSQFNQLLNAIFSTNSNSSEEEIRAFKEHLQREVTTNPILARIMKGNNSLLDACITRQYEHFHPAIKFLILANPFALLWQADNDNDEERIIHMIAGHTSHCVLMPWIA